MWLCIQWCQVLRALNAPPVSFILLSALHGLSPLNVYIYTY